MRGQPPWPRGAGVRHLPRLQAQRKLFVNDLSHSAFAMSDTLPRWEHFEHDADVGVRGWGNTRAEAFEQAAVAMTAADHRSGAGAAAHSCRDESAKRMMRNCC